MGVTLTVGACVALVAAALVAIILPKRPGPSELQARRGGHEIDDRD
jgi:hypothetical protein